MFIQTVGELKEFLKNFDNEITITNIANIKGVILEKYEYYDQYFDDDISEFVDGPFIMFI